MIISCVVYLSIILGTDYEIFNWSNESKDTTDTIWSERYRLMPHVISTAQLQQLIRSDKDNNLLNNEKTTLIFWFGGLRRVRNVENAERVYSFRESVLTIFGKWESPSPKNRLTTTALPLGVLGSGRTGLTKFVLAFPKISTKFVSAKYSIWQAWAHYTQQNIF